ncbi:MAG TPA: glycosyltransferase family 4 protein, partial [Pyrinomonadaceae bacterium]
MRILQVCSARTLGGGERHVADLANALVKRGHDLFAAIIPNSPLIAELTEVPRQNIVRLSLRNSIDLGSAVRLARFARDNRIELIHAHLAKDYVVVAAASRIAGIPYIITRHVLFPMSRAHRRLLSRVSFVIALSNAIAGSLRTAGIFPA